MRKRRSDEDEEEDDEGSQNLRGVVLFGMRELMYCDLPMEQYIKYAGTNPARIPSPLGFPKRAAQIFSGDRECLIASLKRLLETETDSMIDLFAWKWLRDLGEQPSQAQKDEVLAVIMEIGPLSTLEFI